MAGTNDCSEQDPDLTAHTFGQGADCRSWMEETGFRESYVEDLVGPDSMVVGIK